MAPKTSVRGKAWHKKGKGQAMNPSDFCALHHACEDGAKWASHHETMHSVWEHCPRSDWMLWILEQINCPLSNKTARLFACWCVRETPLADGRKVWNLLTDPRSRTAVEVADRYAAGQATLEELDAACDAACDAAWDAAKKIAWRLRDCGCNPPWNDILIATLSVQAECRVYSIDRHFQQMLEAGAGIVLYEPGYGGKYNPN